MTFYDDIENIENLEKHFTPVNVEDAIGVIAWEIKKIKDSQSAYVDILTEGTFSPDAYSGLAELVDDNLNRLYKYVDSLANAVGRARHRQEEAKKYMESIKEAEAGNNK